VRIVTNPAALPGEARQWSITDRPEWVLSDGRVVLAEDGTQQLRFYDAAG
jgi:hypothetical protein